jgi:hypothetical protein
MQQTPLVLEVNTKTTKLREVIEKIIKSKLGMNLPLVMVGATLVFEDGEGLEPDEAENYALNLDKVCLIVQDKRINALWHVLQKFSFPFLFIKRFATFTVFLSYLLK